MFQKDAYEDQIKNAAKLLKDADAVIIGAGAGASTAAGLAYGGKRFRENFAEFIGKYGGQYMTDMYAAGFYPFPSEEARWGYWSKHALINRFDPPALPLYQELFAMVQDKEYFVLTTNVDHQFYKAGFSAERILQHRAIMEKFSVSAAVIQRCMMQKNCLKRWMLPEKTV